MDLTRGLRDLAVFTGRAAASVAAVQDQLNAVSASVEAAERHRARGEDAQAAAVIQGTFARLPEDRQPAAARLVPSADHQAIEARSKCLEELLAELHAKLRDADAQMARDSAAAKTAEQARAVADAAAAQSKSKTAQTLEREAEARRRAERRLAEAQRELENASAREADLASRAVSLQAELDRIAGTAALRSRQRSCSGSGVRGDSPERSSNAPGTSDAEEEETDEDEAGETRQQSERSGVAQGSAGVETGDRVSRKRSRSGSVRRSVCARGAAQGRNRRGGKRGGKRRAERRASHSQGIQGGEPRWWPAQRSRCGRLHAAGFKVLIQDVPLNFPPDEIKAWLLQQRCPDPIDVNDEVGVTRCNRRQICLTFKRRADAICAKRVLHDNDLEANKHATQTRWWKADPPA